MARDSDTHRETTAKEECCGLLPRFGFGKNIIALESSETNPHNLYRLFS